MTQLVLPINRAASIHDVMFNTLGGFLGGLAAVFVVRLIEGSRRSADGLGAELQTEVL
jgi:VanZ family protein